MSRVAEPPVPRGEFPPPRRRLAPDVVELQRSLVAAAAEVHRAQGCGRKCPVVRAAEGDEAAFREVVGDALRRQADRMEGAA